MAERKSNKVGFLAPVTRDVNREVSVQIREVEEVAEEAATTGAGTVVNNYTVTGGGGGSYTSNIIIGGNGVTNPVPSMPYTPPTGSADYVYGPAMGAGLRTALTADGNALEGVYKYLPSTGTSFSPVNNLNVSYGASTTATVHSVFTFDDFNYYNDATDGFFVNAQDPAAATGNEITFRVRQSTNAITVAYVSSADFNFAETGVNSAMNASIFDLRNAIVALGETPPNQTSMRVIPLGATNYPTQPYNNRLFVWLYSSFTGYDGVVLSINLSAAAADFLDPNGNNSAGNFPLANYIDMVGPVVSHPMGNASSTVFSNYRPVSFYAGYANSGIVSAVMLTGSLSIAPHIMYFNVDTSNASTFGTMSAATTNFSCSYSTSRANIVHIAGPRWGNGTVDEFAIGHTTGFTKFGNWGYVDVHNTGSNYQISPVPLSDTATMFTGGAPTHLSMWDSTTVTYFPITDII